MAFSKVGEQIRDGLNVAFTMIWAKSASAAPTAAVNTDTCVPVHALADASETIINPATSDNQVKLSATGTQSNVAGSATDVTILAANANRLMAAILNDSTAVLYLLIGAGTSSATVHTVQLAAGDYYEVPGRYTGVIKGIWASAAGAARVTEFT
jgi:hypothetical protein